MGEFIKSIVRPYITMSSWTVCLYLWARGQEVPEPLLYITSAILAQYIGGRVYKRWRSND